MDKNDSFKSALGVLLIATGLVLLYPFLHSRIPFLAENYRTYDVLKPFKVAVDVVDTSLVIVDTVEAVVDTIETLPLPPQYNGVDYIRPFLEKLNKKSGQIRIAWYGDSAIEGDLICQTVRDSLQDLFGGEGVGFVPLVSHVEGFRQSVFQRATGDWFTWNLAKKDTTIRFPLSFQGTAFGHQLAIDTTDIIAVYDTTIVAVDSTMQIDTNYQVKYIHTVAAALDSVAVDGEDEEAMTAFFAASKRYTHVMRLQPGYLYYGPVQYGGQPAKIKMQIGDTEKEIILNGKKRINRVALNTFACRSMTLTFEELQVQPIYGVSFETPTGVIVDNLPARGNSGGLLRRISAQTLQEFDQSLGVDLVILQYGLNATNEKMTDYSWYKTEMRRVIRRIKEGYQNAQVLLVGPTDKGAKIEGVMTSNPSVEIITKAFREVAQEEQVAFFSFYEQMGGKGTMVDWVEKQQPPLATPDYTHLTFPGGRKAGDLLLQFLLEPPTPVMEQVGE